MTPPSEQAKKDKQVRKLNQIFNFVKIDLQGKRKLVDTSAQYARTIGRCPVLMASSLSGTETNTVRKQIIV